MNSPASRGKVTDNLPPASVVFSIGVVLTLSVFMFESVFSRSSGNATSLTAIAAILLIPLSSPRPFLRFRVLTNSFRYLVPLLLLAGLYLVLQPIGIVPDWDERGQRTVVYILAMFSAGVIGFSITRGHGLHFFALPVAIILLLAVVYWLTGFNAQTTYGSASTKNVVSGAVMHSAFFLAFLAAHRWPMRAKRAFNLALLACICIAVIVGHRAMLPGALGAMILGFLLHRRIVGVGWGAVLFLVFLAFQWYFIQFMSNLNYSLNLVDLNSIVTEWTGRRITSGREDLWHAAAYYLRESPLLGLGTVVVPSNLFRTELTSMHNSFFHVVFQVGFLGLSLLLVQVFVLFVVFSRSREFGGIALGYLFFSLFHATFETFLTSNSYIIGALTWMNMGLLIGLCRPAIIPKAINSWSAIANHASAVK